jgi:hypothetical protein
MFIAGRLLLGIGGVIVGAIGPVRVTHQRSKKDMLIFRKVLVAELAYPDHRATATALSNTQYSMGTCEAW